MRQKNYGLTTERSSRHGPHALNVRHHIFTPNFNPQMGAHNHVPIAKLPGCNITDKTRKNIFALTWVTKSAMDISLDVC